MKYKVRSIMIDIFVDFFGAFMAGIGIYNFALNADFAPVGISGLSIIVNRVFGLPVGTASILINIPLVIISFRILGKEFLLRSFKTMLIFAFVQDIILPNFPVYKGERLLAAMCTGVLCGIGFGVVYLRKSSSGGADFIIMSGKKLKPHLSIGTFAFMVDCVVLIIGAFVFRNVDAVIYGLIASVLTTVVIDKIMYRIGAGKLALIVTDDGKRVGNAISKVTSRGATIVPSEGLFTGGHKSLVLCACKKNQIIDVQRTAYSVDHSSFTMITELDSILGQGFAPYE